MAHRQLSLGTQSCRLAQLPNGNQLKESIHSFGAVAELYQRKTPEKIGPFNLAVRPFGPLLLFT